MTAAEKAREIVRKSFGEDYSHHRPTCTLVPPLRDAIETALLDAKREAFEDAAKVITQNYGDYVWVENAARLIRAKKGELK
jgi:hypothetical protein